MEEPDSIGKMADHSSSDNAVTLTFGGTADLDPTQTTHSDSEEDIGLKKDITLTEEVSETSNAVTLTIGGDFNINGSKNTLDSATEGVVNIQSDDYYQQNTVTSVSLGNDGSEISKPDYGNTVTLPVRAGYHDDSDALPIVEDQEIVNSDEGITLDLNPDLSHPETHSTTAIIGGPQIDLPSNAINIGDEESTLAPTEIETGAVNQFHDSPQEMNTNEDMASMTLPPDYSREISNSSLMAREFSQDEDEPALVSVEGFGVIDSTEKQDAPETLLDEVTDTSNATESSTIEIQIGGATEALIPLTADSASFQQKESDQSEFTHVESEPSKTNNEKVNELLLDFSGVPANQDSDASVDPFAALDDKNDDQHHEDSNTAVDPFALLDDKNDDQQPLAFDDNFTSTDPPATVTMTPSLMANLEDNTPASDNSREAVSMMDDFVAKSMLDFEMPQEVVSGQADTEGDKPQSYESTFMVNTASHDPDDNLTDQSESGPESALEVETHSSLTSHLDISVPGGGLVTELTVESENETQLEETNTEEKSTDHQTIKEGDYFSTGSVVEPVIPSDEPRKLGGEPDTASDELGKISDVPEKLDDDSGNLNDEPVRIGDEEETFQTMDELENEALAGDLLPTLGGLPDDYKHAPNAAPEEYVSDSDSITSETQVSVNVSSDSEVTDTDMQRTAEDTESYEPETLPSDDSPMLSTERVQNDNLTSPIDEKEGLPSTVNIESHDAEMTLGKSDEGSKVELNEITTAQWNLDAKIDDSRRDLETGQLPKTNSVIDISLQPTPVSAEIDPDISSMMAHESRAEDLDSETSVPIVTDDSIMLPDMETKLFEPEVTSDAEADSLLTLGKTMDYSLNLSHSPMDDNSLLTDEKQVPMDQNIEDMIQPETTDEQRSEPLPPVADEGKRVPMDQSVEELIQQETMDEQRSGPMPLFADNDNMDTSATDEQSIHDAVMSDQEVENSKEIDQAFEFLENTQATPVTEGIFLPQVDTGADFESNDTYGSELSPKYTEPESESNAGLSLADELQQALNQDEDQTESYATSEAEPDKLPNDGSHLLEPEYATDIDLQEGEGNRKTEFAINYAPLKNEDEDNSYEFRGLESWNSQEELTFGADENNLESDQGGLSVNISGFQKEATFDDSSDEESGGVSTPNLRGTQINVQEDEVNLLDAQEESSEAIHEKNSIEKEDHNQEIQPAVKEMMAATDLTELESTPNPYQTESAYSFGDENFASNDVLLSNEGNTNTADIDLSTSDFPAVVEEQFAQTNLPQHETVPTSLFNVPMEEHVRDHQADIEESSSCHSLPDLDHDDEPGVTASGLHPGQQISEEILAPSTIDMLESDPTLSSRFEQPDSVPGMQDSTDKVSSYANQLVDDVISAAKSQDLESQQDPELEMEVDIDDPDFEAEDDFSGSAEGFVMVPTDGDEKSFNDESNFEHDDHQNIEQDTSIEPEGVNPESIPKKPIIEEMIDVADVNLQESDPSTSTDVEPEVAASVLYSEQPISEEILAPSTLNTQESDPTSYADNGQPDTAPEIEDADIEPEGINPESIPRKPIIEEMIDVADVNLQESDPSTSTDVDPGVSASGLSSEQLISDEILAPSTVDIQESEPTSSLQIGQQDTTPEIEYSDAEPEGATTESIPDQPMIEEMIDVAEVNLQESDPSPPTDIEPEVTASELYSGQPFSEEILAPSTVNMQESDPTSPPHIEQPEPATDTSIEPEGVNPESIPKKSIIEEMIDVADVNLQESDPSTSTDGEPEVAASELYSEQPISEEILAPSTLNTQESDPTSYADNGQPDTAPEIEDADIEPEGINPGSIPKKPIIEEMIDVADVNLQESDPSTSTDVDPGVSASGLSSEQLISEEILAPSTVDMQESDPTSFYHIEQPETAPELEDTDVEREAVTASESIPEQPIIEEMIAVAEFNIQESDPSAPTEPIEQDVVSSPDNFTEGHESSSQNIPDDLVSTTAAKDFNMESESEPTTRTGTHEQMLAPDQISQQTDDSSGTAEGFVIVPTNDYNSKDKNDQSSEHNEQQNNGQDSSNIMESPMHTSNTTNDSIDNLADQLDDVHTPTIGSQDLDLDSTLMDAMNDTPTVEPLPELTASEEREERSMKEVTIDDQTVTLDMKVISEYKTVYSHGGYADPEYKQAIIVLSACEFPSRSNPDYHHIMDQLFLYVYHSIQQLVVEEYIIIYYQGGASKSQLPGLKWMKRCHDRLSHSARKSIKKLFIVHPTFWTRTVLFWSRPFISSKFVRKVELAYTLEKVNKVLPLQNVPIPEKVRMYDLNLVR